MANDPRFEVYPRREHLGTRTEAGKPVEELAGPRDGEYGWRFKAANGQITATSGEGFTRIEDAERAVEDFLGWIDERMTNHEELPILRVDE